jgi:hypothetical protein
VIRRADDGDFDARIVHADERRNCGPVSTLGNA